MSKVAYAIRDVVVAAQKFDGKPGPQMLKLNIGDPNAYDFDTPQYIKQALYNAVEHGKFGGYADSSGYLPLRQQIVESNALKGIKTGVEDVLVTTGTSEATNMLYGAMLNPGDEILVPSPSYPQYENLAYYYGATPKTYEMSEEKGFQPDFDSLEKAVGPRTKAVVVINPNNPTGAVHDKATLHKFIDFAAKHKLVLISDEIYDSMMLDGKHVSTASLTKEAQIITFNGLSKNCLAPGWRVGWATFSNFADSTLRSAVEQLCRLRLSAPYPAQVATAAALSDRKQYDESVRLTLAKLRPRRDMAFKRLNEISGISCAKPQGAFYAFPQIHDTHNTWKTDKEWVLQLLEEQRVLTVYGCGFSEKPGTKHFRIVFLPNEQILGEAFDRIEKFMKNKGY